MKTDLYSDTEVTPRPREIGKLAVYAITILAVLLIGYLLSRAMRTYLPAPQINAKRADERRAALAELRATTHKELFGDAAIINPANNVVRLPIERAIELTIQGHKNPAAFRTNLLARVENATKPPPKAPEKPSEFE